MDASRGLKDQVIIITGGCGDIGSATAQKLAAFGARVILWDILDDDAGRSRVQKVGAVEYRNIDQGNSVQVHEGVQDVAKRFGRLDVVIGNAVNGSLGRLLDRSWEDWQESFRVNVTGCAMLA